MALVFAHEAAEFAFSDVRLATRDWIGGRTAGRAV